MLNRNLEQTLNGAFENAKNKRHEFITVEHLLLALTDNASAVDVLEACGANIQQLKSDLSDFVDNTTPLIPHCEYNKDTQPTLGFQRVLQRAVFHVQSSGRKEVTGANVLVALFSEQESQAVYFLNLQNIARIDVVNYVAHGISRVGSQEDRGFESDSYEDEMFKDRQTATSALEAYTFNLNESAKKGRIDAIIGRAQELERLAQILARRRKNNPLLVGEAGVGKTAIAEGLAKNIVEGNVPDVLAKAIVYSLDMGALLAGTKYRGDFEKRFKTLLSELMTKPNAILYIDEIHTIIGAGAASGGVMDASNLLKPLLSSDQLRCIGSTTFQEFRGIFEKDRPLARRFQKIDICEPTSAETFEILRGLKPKFEAHHQIKYQEKALQAAVEFAQRYINDRHMPDKAIDVIDEAGAFLQLSKHKRKRKKTITTDDIKSIVAKMTGIPVQSLNASAKNLLARLDECLKSTIFGQDEAINKVTTVIKMSKAGLDAHDRPVASFVFAGPTGVGKTELTKNLAEALGIPLLRFDMSEYMERHTVSRLIGAPPGYVGYDQGGLLTEAVNKKPHSVVLLDEIEKAHPDVFNLLLQVMDYGVLTDNNGRKADFKNVILIMTTNAGSFEATRGSLGFTRQDHSTDMMGILKKTFTPEFRNRLDAIVQFKMLSEEQVGKVVDKCLSELQRHLEDKKIVLKVPQSARALLVRMGYNKELGARPMAQVIKEHVKIPLSEEILFGRLGCNGGTVRLVARDGKLILNVQLATKSLGLVH